MTEPAARRSALVPGVLLALLTVAVFAAGFRNGFVNWDDPGAIVENEAIRDLSPGSVARLFREPTFFAYVPLTFLSYAIDYRLFGPGPFGFHLTSLLLHVAAALLLFRLALRWTGGSPWLAAACAAVFAVHPAQVECVTWMAGRKDPLAAALLFGGFLAFARGLESRGASRAALFALSLALAALANLAKASAIVFPLLFLAHDLAVTPRERRGGAGALARRHAPFFAAAGLLAALHLVVAAGAGVTSPGGDAVARLVRAGQVFLHYAAKTLFPVGLSPHYEFGLAALPGLAGLLAFGALAAFAAVSLARGRCRASGLGAALFVAALLPVNTIFPATSVLAADRYLYLPLAGAGLGFAAALRAGASRSRPAAAAASLAALAALSFLTVRQQSFWLDSETLWARAAAVEPGSALVLLKRAEVRVARSLDAGAASDRLRELADAEALFREALASTRVAAHELQAREGLALVLLQSGRASESEAEYDALLSRLDSGLAAGKPDLEVRRFRANAVRNRGQARLLAGRTEAALDDFASAVRLEPENADGRYNLGTVLAKLGFEGSERGDLDAAVRELSEAARLRPGFGDAWIQLGTVEKGRRNLVGAVKAFESAAAAEPARADAFLALARLWIAEGLVDEGEKAAARAKAAAPADPRPSLLLGQIALAKGDLDAAEVQFNQAAAAAPDLEEARAGLANVHLERSERAAKRGDAGEAERRAAAAKALLPGSAAPRLRLADLLAKRRARDLAKTEYDELVARFPGDADVATAAAAFYKELGYFHLLRKEEAEAVRSFTAAVALRPDDPSLDAVKSILRSRQSEGNRPK